MKTKTTILAVLAALAGTASGDDVATLESNLRSDILSKVDQVNPIDPATGARKYISFAMISDIHKCKRVAGDNDATNPVQTYWYGSAGCLTESEQSIRLLGSLATAAGLDAVLNGGDLSTAPIMGDGTKHGLTEAEYTNEIWNVKAMFDQYLPATVPLFTVDGNHERSYTAQNANMQMSDAAWAYVLTNFNTSAAAAHAQGVDVTYHRDLAAAKLGDNQTGRFTGNSYHLDFRRLVASGGCNVRLACVSMYDAATGADPAYRVYDAAQFYDASGNLYDAALTPGNTVMGMVAHGTEEKLDGTMARGAAGTLMNGFMNGWSNPKAHTGPWNHGTQGKAFFGLVSGHLHFTNSKEITDAYDDLVNGDNTVYASAVSVASAYAVNYPAKPSQHELGTEAAYHFSIFVVDTDSNLLREVRVGGWSSNPVTHENPVVQIHETNIRTHLDPAAQTAPVLGTVTVVPGVTNATLSGTIASLGTGATACDAYLALGPSAGALGAATKIAEGATASFGYVISDLTASTTYYYSLSVSNNAEIAMGAAKTGSFTTQAEPVEPPDGPILPGETPAATRQTIQDAIDAAAILPEPGTVTLGAGLFEIDAQLMVTGGVTLAGQGWDDTVVRQTEVVPTAENNQATRVLTVGAGSTVRGLALTGGRVTGGNNQCGGGVFVDGGTVSWCCITNNSVYGQNNKYGGGIGFSHCSGGTIDHSIVADNTVSVTTGVEFGGGGIGGYFPEGSVTIDSCLVAGNRSIHANDHYGKGGGIGVNLVYRDYTVTVRNTTVVGNTAGEDGATAVSEGGGVFTAVDTHGTFAMVDCIVAGNTTTGTNTTVSLSYDGGVDWCLFDVEDDKIGANSLFGAPAFVDAADGDYRLAWNSPAVGNGETYEGIGSDLAGAAFAEIPSMGCYEYGDLAATPAFALPSGSCFHPATNVTISCGTAAAKIYYTTDGSRPTVASTPYDGPFEVSATTTIKARAYAEGLGPSAVATATYTLRRPTDGVIHPSGDTTGATDASAIQAAIDAAAPTHGTVVLGEGLFDVNVQLWVTNGVTLVGQGWTNTTIRYAGKKGSDGRVANISGGSTVGHVTLTGGKVDNNNKSGGGAFITEGTITWCCVSNNYAIRSDGGGGIFVYRGNDDPAKVRIDHTIVANNAAGTNFLAGVGGGIGIHGRNNLEVEIESCLVYGNVSGKPDSNLASHGGGIAVTGVASTDRFTTTILNTTIADNRTVGAGLGGGLYIDQPDTTLVNCLIANNTAASGDGNVAFKSAAIAEAVAALASNNLFGDGTTVFGANPVGLAGSVAFVDAAAGDYHLSDASLVRDKGADYAGIGTDLDGRAYAWPPSIGCYEYGTGVRPQPTWDVPVAGGGGIKGLDDGQGGTTIVFTSIERAGTRLTVGFRAAQIDANGATVGLLCKEDLASGETLVLNAVLADDGSGEATLATLTTTTDLTRLFAVGICTAAE